MKSSTPELLAPAGSPACAHAALDAGADAIYLGLSTLNARRGADNFSAEELTQIVTEAHARKAHVYLTLNIDLSERENGLAARMLQLATESGVDAVLFRDPALIPLIPLFPKLAFHFSTQAACANSLDVRMAGEFGVSRVVLARELTLEEVRAASIISEVETEVFVQGALCFSVSGRCLLSSWGGGHSGNRGTCTSPCRVPWSQEGEARPVFSMHDLSAVTRVKELAHAGVACLKIEGRLKKAEWVAEATNLYRQALDGVDPHTISDMAKQLGDYTGRSLTCGYLDGKRDDLTGDAGRPAIASEEAPAMARAPKPQGVSAYSLSIMEADKGILCTFTAGNHQESWNMPRTAVKRANKASTIAEICEWLKDMAVQDTCLESYETDMPNWLVPPRNTKHLLDHISAALHRANKRSADTIGIELSEEVRLSIQKGNSHARNQFPLGTQPTHVRLHIGHADIAERFRAETVTFEGVTISRFDKILKAADDMAVALPPVFYEHDIPAMRELVQACAAEGVLVEANSWGGVYLAREAEADFVIGPGMGILNSLAARTFGNLGALSVMASIEADREKLEDLSAHCDVPLMIMVYGRPVLAWTRAQVDDPTPGVPFADRRNIVVQGTRERSLTAFRPLLPFDISRLRNPAIKASGFVVDLVSAENPMDEWNELWLPNKDTFLFNYDRTLQ